MKRVLVFTILLAALLVGCGGSPTSTAVPTPTVGPPTSTPPPSATPMATPTPAATETGVFIGLPLPVDRSEHFVGSGVCVICHTNMKDEAGKDVSIDTFWRSTMMANAARDPYWKASVRSQIQVAPDQRSLIEDKCATCHTPMARFSDSIEGQNGVVLDAGYLDAANPRHATAMDGVSCTLCHQIREETLGLSRSFSGAFAIDPSTPLGDRVLYGPYSIQEQQAEAMRGASGFLPEQGLHVNRSELCATCHTLYTPYVNSAGRIVGQFPEQMAYLEWFYSSYRRLQSCQDCHMPEATGGVRAALGSPVLRSPFMQHAFVGGNAYMLQILETFGEELGVTASSEDFEGTILRTLSQLQENAATITISRAQMSGGALVVDLVVENKAGHKLPTGYPSRRAWLHFVVRDSAGEVVFESGAVNADGSIVGNDNDIDPQAYEPHHLAISDPDQVQIYEVILLDSDGLLTTQLLRAATYIKDNRLLPAGFEKLAPYDEIAVRGQAWGDSNFLGGSDKIEYMVRVGRGRAPFDVTVELLYQSVGYPWALNLRGQQGQEIEDFLRYYDAVPNTAVVVASATVQVSP